MAFLALKSGTTLASGGENRIDFEKLRQHSNLSIVFSAADLNNPESVFGHIFLVFHSSEHPGPLDPVVEFYGKLKEVEYGMLKTVISEIPGVYKPASFGEKTRQYDLENRDLLIRKGKPGITPETVIDRLQSLGTGDHPYDFLNRNCAFYMEMLVTGAPEQFSNTWKIRQPFDVLAEYGDPSTEKSIRSTSRYLAEFKRLEVLSRQGDHVDAQSVYEGVTYHEARNSVLRGKAGPLLDSYARILMSRPMPESGLAAPLSNQKREKLSLSISSNHAEISFAGFDTGPGYTSDPLASPNKLEVGKTRLFCRKEKECISDVTLFSTLTSPSDGFGLARNIGSSVRLDNGARANIQAGIGIGYGKSGLSIGLIPVVVLDTKGKGRDLDQKIELSFKFSATYRPLDSGVMISAQINGSSNLSPVDQREYTIQLDHPKTGLHLSISDQESVTVGWSRRF